MVSTYKILSVKSVHVPVGHAHHELDVVDDSVRDVVQVDGVRHRFENSLKLKESRTGLDMATKKRWFEMGTPVFCYKIGGGSQ